MTGSTELERHIAANEARLMAREGWRAATHGVLINSALVLFLNFAAAMVWNYRDAAALTILAVGATYLSYLTQVMPGPRVTAYALVIISIVLGAGAIGLTIFHLANTLLFAR